MIDLRHIFRHFSYFLRLDILQGKEAVGIDIKSPEKKSKVSFVGRASEMMQQVSSPPSHPQRPCSLVIANCHIVHC